MRASLKYVIRYATLLLRIHFGQWIAPEVSVALTDARGKSDLQVVVVVVVGGNV